MTPDTALALITAVGVIGTCANVYLTQSIKNEILKNRLWVTENFVRKDELRAILNISQIRESADRVAHG